MIDYIFRNTSKYENLCKGDDFDRVLEHDECNIDEAISPTEEGHINVDMSVADRKLTNNLKIFANHICLKCRNEDEYRNNAMFVLEGESDYIDTKTLSDLSVRDSDKLCKIESTVMDIGKKRMNELFSAYLCQNGYYAHTYNERWRTEHLLPSTCVDEDCNAPISKKKKQSSQCVRKDIQQIVFGELDKDDKNSMRVVGEVDRHLIDSVDRRESVNVWAIPKIADTENQKKKFYLHVVGVESIDDDVTLDEETIDKVESIADEEDDIIQHLADSVAPSIVPKVGHDTARKAVLASAVKATSDAVDSRNTINTLLYGKPGSGKSNISQYIVDITTNSKYVDGAQSTAAGILGSVVQEETIDNDNGSWITIAGAIPQCHGGLVAIDELDKAGDKTQKSLNTPMESGKVVIDKAGGGELKAETSVVAACNPKHESYMGDAPIAALDLNRSLKDRFDIIVRVDDDVAQTAAEEREFIEEKQRRKLEGVEGVLDEDNLKEYIEYAKTKNPEYSDAAKKAITDKIVELRIASREVQLDSVNLTGRVDGKLTRISSAMAKLRLADVVTVEDVEIAWNLIRESWQSLTHNAFDFEDTYDLIEAASIASNPSQQQVMRQTLGALNVAQNDENQLQKDIVYEAVDADNQVADWSLSTLQNKGHIRIDDETITVLDLPQ